MWNYAQQYVTKHITEDIEKVFKVNKQKWNVKTYPMQPHDRSTLWIRVPRHLELAKIWIRYFVVTKGIDLLTNNESMLITIDMLPGFWNTENINKSTRRTNEITPETGKQQSTTTTTTTIFFTNVTVFIIFFAIMIMFFSYFSGCSHGVFFFSLYKAEEFMIRMIILWKYYIDLILSWQFSADACGKQ